MVAFVGHKHSHTSICNVFDDAYRGRVCAVGSTESVVYIHICQRSECSGKRWVVLFFLRMETKIFKQDYFAGIRFADCVLSCIT